MDAKEKRLRCKHRCFTPTNRWFNYRHPGIAVMRSVFLFSVASLLLSTLGSCAGENRSPDQTRNKTRETDIMMEGDVYAPEFPAGLEWLNVSSPITLKSLRGKFVLIDFWTYCCINCMHVLPDLKMLEEKYRGELVVIGVHSAKFPNEQGTENIRQAVLRYEIEHPVVNDKDFRIWQEYTVNAWPTLTLINPLGKIIAMRAGEGVFKHFDPILSAGIPYFEERKLLRRGETAFEPESEKSVRSVLSFPGKIHAGTVTGLLYISDSNNNRIIVSKTDGTVVDVIGSGIQGAGDGAFEDARFNHPQGVFLADNTLYIADTENHMVRAADMRKRTVETIFGNGSQAIFFDATTTGKGLALNSPWDVLVHDGTLYIAMAGSHQIWAADLNTGKARIHAGSGREGLRDGELILSALAQPSGLTSDGKRLYFADSETSSIRWADFNPRGETGTLIGEDLFEFGDADGDYKTARLQHPLGITYADGRLYIADTYNSKIKTIDIAKRQSQSFSGIGRRGYQDGGFDLGSYYEPGGLCSIGDVLYIADTNNHLIRILNKAKRTVSTLRFKNLDKLAPPQESKHTSVRLDKRTIRRGGGIIEIRIPLPEGYQPAADAPHSIQVESSDIQSIQFDYSKSKISIQSDALVARYAVSASSGQAEIGIRTVVYYCSKGSGLCLIDMQHVTLPVTAGTNAPASITVDLPVLLKR